MLSPRSLAAAAGSALLAVTLAATAADLGKAAPGQAGFSASRLSRIDDVVKTAIADRQIAGAVVAVARNNKLVYLKSFGKSDAESGRAMTDDTIFRIASMTKPITSVAVMMLQEEGKLLISDPLSKYIPEFKDAKVLVAKDPADPAKGYDTVPAKRAVTLQDLLSHTSGISYRFWGGPTSALYEQAGASDGLEPTAGTIAEGREEDGHRAARLATRRALRVRSQHRHPRARRGSRVGHAARPLLRGAHLPSAWHEGHAVLSRRRAERPPRGPAHPRRQGWHREGGQRPDPLGRAGVLGGRADVGHAHVLLRWWRPEQHGARLPAFHADAAERAACSMVPGCSDRSRWS